MKKIILYLLICLITIGSFTIANAEVADNEIVRIGVDEAIDNIDITTLNQYSKATDYIWTCMYDRLLEYDEAGELSLAQLIGRCGTFRSFQFIIAVLKKLLLNDSIAFMGWAYKNI